MVKDTPIKKKVAVVTTSVLQVNFFLVPHLKALHEKYDVTLVLRNDFPQLLENLNLLVKIHFVSIERKVHPVKDLRTLFQLVRFFRQQQFDMVHSVNPKAGLLGMLAAWLVRVPVRAHIFQGEVWANKTGVWRFILRNLDRLVSFCSTSLTVVSQSERELLVHEKIISASKSSVLASGSIGGVDLKKFTLNPMLRQQLREQYGYASHHIVFMYLGRLTREKGLVELAQAFEKIALQNPQACLHLVGPDEDNMQQAYQPLLQAYPKQVRLLPFSEVPEQALQVADVLILPSHREGFGVVVIEAAALGIPAIGSRIYGISDALLENETGLMFEKQNANDLAGAMQIMVNQPELRTQLGLAAQARTRQCFDQELVIAAFLAYYRTLLDARA